ncbi:MAG TPA: Smr/MutS family protein [Pyrinomonadaceae bacterium]|nr:Smr/MutS family protein [Pyrinomonadaceae bacterium]
MKRLTDLIRRVFGTGGRPDETCAARADEGGALAGCGAGDVEADPFEGADPFDPFPEPVCLEITDVFDLHSIPPREVRAVVEEYLSEALRLGFRQVRIIHGKGVGVQREIVRKVLARTPFVEHFSDAPPEAGGWGATIARLSAVRTAKD